MVLEKRLQTGGLFRPAHRQIGQKSLRQGAILLGAGGTRGHQRLLETDPAVLLGLMVPIGDAI